MADSLSGQVHKEIEDRFVLKALPKEVEGIKPVTIRQGILREVKKDKDIVAYARVRAYEEPGKAIKYSLGVKHFPLSQESETNISREMFDAFYPNHLDKPQEKKRYILDKGWIIDKKGDGEIVAERERKSSQSDSKLPDGWVEKIAFKFGLMPDKVKAGLPKVDALKRIRMNSFKKSIDKLAFIGTYDPKVCRPAKPIHPDKGSAGKPIIVKRDYADEMGGAISSGGSPMSTGE